MSTPEERLWDSIRDQLNRIENKLDKKVDYRTFNEWKEEVSERVDRLDKELEEIKKAAISPAQVTQMVGEGLKDSQARGLTSWDRRVRYGLGLLSLGTFVLLLFDHYG